MDADDTGRGDFFDPDRIMALMLLVLMLGGLLFMLGYLCGAGQAQKTPDGDSCIYCGEDDRSLLKRRCVTLCGSCCELLDVDGPRP